MGTFDLIVALIFSLVSLAALVGAFFCLRKALRVSGEVNGDIKMFFWAVGALINFIISGLSAAYILIPLFLSYS